MQAAVAQSKTPQNQSSRDHHHPSVAAAAAAAVSRVTGNIQSPGVSLQSMQNAIQAMATGAAAAAQQGLQNAYIAAIQQVNYCLNTFMLFWAKGKLV